MTQSENVYSDHLRELHSSDFEIAVGEPDIRNWKVIGLQNKELGKVEELLFQDISHEVKYLIVNLNGKPLNLVSRLILIPVGLVDLLRDEKIVLVNRLNIGHLASLPTYEKGKISRETEIEIRDLFSPDYVSSRSENNIVDDREIYNRQQFNERAQTRLEVTERNSAKEEIRENIERVKDSVRKMENEVEKLGGSGISS